MDSMMLSKLHIIDAETKILFLTYCKFIRGFSFCDWTIVQTFHNSGMFPNIAGPELTTKVASYSTVSMLRQLDLFYRPYVYVSKIFN